MVAHRATTRRRMAEYLTEAGYAHVHQADSGGTALPMLQNGRYDLLIADIDMPGKQGIDLLRMVRADKVTNKLPIVMIGGQAQLEQSGVATDSGTNGVLLKPVTAELLQQKIDQVFSRLIAA